MKRQQIAGEDVDAIVAALLLMKVSEPDEDGMVETTIHAPITQVAPLFRALMRVEAQLLLAEAADFPETEESQCTDSQRQVDALLEIAKRIRILSVSRPSAPRPTGLDDAPKGTAR